MKDNKRSFFERWKFITASFRSNVQILAQTRWVNELHTTGTESEFENL